MQSLMTHFSLTQSLVYSVTGLVLFGIGLYGLIVTAHILRKIIAINITGVGVFMLLIATSSQFAGAADPVPHAMVLTGIVVAVAGTALALSLACRIAAMRAVAGNRKNGQNEEPGY